MMNDNRPISSPEVNMETIAARICCAKNISDDIAGGVRRLYSAIYGGLDMCEPVKESKTPQNFSDNLNLYMESIAATREMLFELLNRMGI